MRDGASVARITRINSLLKDSITRAGGLFLDMYDTFTSSRGQIRIAMFEYENIYKGYLHLSRAGTNGLAGAIRDWVGKILNKKIWIFPGGVGKSGKIGKLSHGTTLHA